MADSAHCPPAGVGSQDGPPIPARRRAEAAPSEGSKFPISTAGSEGSPEVVRKEERIYQDLVSKVGFGGSYQSVKRFVLQRRQAEPAEPQRGVEIEPVEEAQVDFGTGAWVVDEQSGSRRRPWVLRVVLGFSRKAYSEAFFRQDTEHFLRGVENA